jgi:hypothetical protein
MATNKTYDVTVEEVYSGDDLILMVDLGVGGLFRRVRARLLGVDTPSAFRASGDTEAGEVRSLLRKTVMQGKCSVELHAEGKGGWLVTLFVEGVEGVTNINDMMKSLGYVYTHKIGNR